jgi:ribosomal protein S27AE
MTTLRPADGPAKGLYHSCPAERCPSCLSTMILAAPNRWFCQWCGATKVIETEAGNDPPGDKSTHHRHDDIHAE